MSRAKAHWSWVCSPSWFCCHSAWPRGLLLAWSTLGDHILLQRWGATSSSSSVVYLASPSEREQAPRSLQTHRRKRRLRAEDHRDSQGGHGCGSWKDRRIPWSPCLAQRVFRLAWPAVETATSSSCPWLGHLFSQQILRVQACSIHILSLWPRLVTVRGFSPLSIPAGTNVGFHKAAGQQGTCSKGHSKASRWHP